MVEPGRTAGGEGVVQPEPVGARDGVGDVGERRGSFVRSDDEVRVVAVVANCSFGRDDLPVDEVVRDVEQRADEDPVCRDAFGQPRLAVSGRIGQALGEEAALRSGGHYDGVFDRLGFDQTEDLGAEILPAVRPAQPAAGHRPETQMHTLHARRIHPYFVQRPRLRKKADATRLKLEGERRRPGQIGVRAHDGVDDGEKPAGNPFVVEGGGLSDAFGQGPAQFAGIGLVAGAEPGLKILDESPCQFGVLHKGFTQVGS